MLNVVHDLGGGGEGSPSGKKIFVKAARGNSL